MGNIGRNQPCPCGSGLKFKRCHGRLDGLPPPMDVRDIFRVKDADERIRELQQGSGRPIVSAEVNGHRLVGVNNTAYWSKNWNSFTDFLNWYAKKKLGEDWGNAELAKPPAERHPFIQIFDAYSRQAKQASKNVVGDGVFEFPFTGAVACYLGVAHSLYLLDHNVELQERLLNRLRNKGNFAGAYYELWIAGALIRAGFDLELNDEKGGGGRQCEWDAISKDTRKRYTVEVKMRGAEGQLGRTAADGGPDAEPKFANLLIDALKKPAPAERMVFIDVNVPHVLGADGAPTWGAEVIEKLQDFELTRLPLLGVGVHAYLFMTNLAFHRQLEVSPGFAVATFGLGMPDFSRPGMIALSTAYEQRRKHADAFKVIEYLKTITTIPATFDGALPSESFGQEPRRILVGQTYFFPAGEAGGDIEGKVEDVAVMGKDALVMVHDLRRGRRVMLRMPLDERQLADYARFGDSYFGKEFHKHVAEDEFELFEFFMEHEAKKKSREKILEWFAPNPQAQAYAATLSDEELRLYYCECLVASGRKGPRAA